MAKKRLRRSVSFNERKNSKQKLFWIILTLIIIVGVLFVAWRYFNANENPQLSPCYGSSTNINGKCVPNQCLNAARAQSISDNLTYLCFKSVRDVESWNRVSASCKNYACSLYRSYTDKSANLTSSFERTCSRNMDMPDEYITGCKTWCPSGKVWDGGKCVATGATVYTLQQGESQTISTNGKSYEVTAYSISTTPTPTVKLEINGYLTRSLIVGESQLLSNGVTVKIADISWQKYAGGIKKVTFILNIYSQPTQKVIPNPIY